MKACMGVVDMPGMRGLASGRLQRIETDDPTLPRYRAMNFSGGGVHIGFTQLLRLVLDFFHFGEGDEAGGYTRAMLFDWARGVAANEHQVEHAIDLLIAQGHIYSTIDDEHFKATF